jgi:hypothetical protein
MRKTASIAILFGAALLSFSCAKENTVKEPEPKLVSITVEAGIDNSKTHLDGNDVRWDATGETIQLFERHGDNVVIVESKEGVSTDGGATMSFESNIYEKSGEGFTYCAIYPASAYQSGVPGLNNVGVNTPYNQKPTATSFDPKADLLFAEKLETATQASVLSMRFARMVAVGCMTIKNLGTQENVESVTFSAKKGGQDVVVAGRSAYNLETTQLSGEYGSRIANTSVKMDYTGKTLAANGLTVWFTCYPFELVEGDSFKVEIVTETGVYTKESTLPAGRTLAFNMGKPSVFGVNMSGITATPKAVNLSYANLTAEEWVNAGGVSTYSNVTVSKAHGDIWTTNAVLANSATTAFQLRRADQNGDKSYVGLPVFAEEIDHITVTIVGASTSNLKLFFADALEENDSELSVEPSNTTGEYTIDLSSVSKKTGYIRGTGAAPYISKIEVFTKNDARPALSAPANVAAAVDPGAANTINVSWDAVDGAAEYVVKLVSGSTTLSQTVNGATSASFTNLNYETEYTASVAAVSADQYVTSNSPAASAAAVTTGTSGGGTLAVPADGTMIWTEDFTGWETRLSSASGASHVYGGGTVNYDGNFTFRANEAFAEGTAPEILVGGSGGTFTVSNVPIAGATAATLTYKSNYDRCALTVTQNNGHEIEGVQVTSISFSGKTKTWAITGIPASTSTFMLTLTNNNSGNCRVDNLLLVAGANVPQPKTPQTLSFATASVTWVVGTDCTLNTAKAGQTVNGAHTAVTYTSSNANIAAVNASTGAITPKAAGVVTITATAAEDDTYEAGSTTYSLTIVNNGGGGGGQGGSWVATPLASLTASDVFVIVCTKSGGTFAMPNDGGASSAPSAESVTISDGKLTGTVADNLKWNISISNDGYTFHPNGSTNTWLYCTNTNNGVRVGTNTDKVFVEDSGYLKHTGTNRYVGVYSTQDWRCYTSITGNSNIKGQTFTYYKYVSE